MNCPYCNKEIPDGSQFCTYCGQGLESQGGTEPVQQPENKQPENVSAPDETTETSSVSLSKEKTSTENGAPLAGGPQPEGETSPEGEAQPQKKSNKKLAVGAAVVAGAAIIGFAAFQMFPTKDSKTVVVDAFKSIVAEGQTDPMEEMFGVNELYNKLQKEPAEINMELVVNEISDPDLSVLKTGKVTITAKQDVEKKQYFAKMGIGYADMDIANLEMYFDDKRVSMAVPELSAKAFNFNYGDDLEGQINNSPFLGKMVLDSGVDFNAFKDYFQYIIDAADTSDGQIFDVKALWERYKTGSQAIENLKAAMTVEKGEKKSLMVDGKDQKCQGYKTVITKDAWIEFLKTSKDFFLEDETIKKDFLEYMTQIMKLSNSMMVYSYTDPQSPEEMQEALWTEIDDNLDSVIAQLEESLGDMNMVVYVDNKGRLVGLDAETTAVIDDTDYVFTLNAELQGGYRLTANGNAVLTIASEDETLTLNFLKTGTYDDNAYTCTFEFGGVMEDDSFSLTYDGSYNRGDSTYNMDLGLKANNEDVFSLTSDGEVQDLEKGKTISLIMDSIRLEVPDADLSMELGANYKIASLAGEVGLPQGETFDIFAATEAEWSEVIEEIGTNVWGLLYQFQ